MEGLPSARIEAHPLPAEAVEAAIRLARENGRAEARGERSPWVRPRGDERPRREAIV